MRTRYSPPPIDQAELLAELMDKFPSHKKPNRQPDELLYELVHSYLMWWVLMVTFPERRIVGTGPHWVVRQVHASNLERFYYDCLGYLGRTPQKEDLWGGELDFSGTRETAFAIRQLFDFPDKIWLPILRADEAQRKELVTRIH